MAFAAGEVSDCWRFFNDMDGSCPTAAPRSVHGTATVGNGLDNPIG